MTNAATANQLRKTLNAARRFKLQYQLPYNGDVYPISYAFPTTASWLRHINVTLLTLMHIVI